MSALNHGINVYKNDTKFSAVVQAQVAIPFYIGAWPCHAGKGYSDLPQLCTGFEEAKEYGGYSDDWRDNDGRPKWSLCQAMYSQFKLFGAAPAIFCNVYNPEVHKKSVAASEKAVTDHCVKLTYDALNTDALIVKTTAGETVTLVKDTDYETYYTDKNLVIELLPDSEYYGEIALNIAYDMADLSKFMKAVVPVEAAEVTVADHAIDLPVNTIDDNTLVIKSTGETSETLVKGTDYETALTETALKITLKDSSGHYADESLNVAYTLLVDDVTSIETAIEKVEECNARFGIVPDLLCAPGWTQVPEVAQLLAAKAPAINGLFHAKAVVDLDTSETGADSYDDVKTFKEANGYTDENMIVCWPLVKVGERLFDYSAYLCGHMAVIDSGNSDVPYESPSNKDIGITGCVNAAGNDISLTVGQADVISVEAGTVTCINFNGWKVWGNYTGCYSAGETDVAKIFICTNRMMDFICNTFVKTYWSYIDRPLTRVLIDAIVNSFNTWLNGLTHDGKLYGGEIQYVEANNPLTDLIGGKFRLDAAVASPVPAQRIDMFVEYDVNILVEALTAVTGG